MRICVLYVLAYLLVGDSEKTFVRRGGGRSSPLKEVVVGLQDLHLHWYGLEHGSGPPTPLLTTAHRGRRKRARVSPLDAPVVFGSWTLKRGGRRST